MWKAYTGVGKIDAQNLYCAASGALLKEMANRGVVNCVYHRFSAPSPLQHCDFRHGDTVTSGYEFSTANEWQLFDVRVGGFQLHECSRPAPFGWRSDTCRKSHVFAMLMSEAHLLEDNTMYCFAKE